MPGLTVESLCRIRDDMRSTRILREGIGRAKITVHMGTCGISAGARKIMEALLKIIEEKDVKDVILTASGCAGFCSREPMATVELVGESPVKYVNLTEEKIRTIFTKHILDGEPVQEYALTVVGERVH